MWKPATAAIRTYIDKLRPPASPNCYRRWAMRFVFIMNIFYCIIFIFVFGDRSFFFFFFTLNISFPRQGLPAWHRENCWLYSLGNTCWFFVLAYLFRSRGWVGKIIGFAKPATNQAEIPRKRQSSERRRRRSDFRRKRQLCWRFERGSFCWTPERRWNLQWRSKPVCLCWLW